MATRGFKPSSDAYLTYAAMHCQAPQACSCLPLALPRILLTKPAIFTNALLRDALPALAELWRMKVTARQGLLSKRLSRTWDLQPWAIHNSQAMPIVRAFNACGFQLPDNMLQMATYMISAPLPQQHSGRSGGSAAMGH